MVAIGGHGLSYCGPQRSLQHQGTDDSGSLGYTSLGFEGVLSRPAEEHADSVTEKGHNCHCWQVGALLRDATWMWTYDSQGRVLFSFFLFLLLAALFWNYPTTGPDRRTLRTRLKPETILSDSPPGTLFVCYFMSKCLVEYYRNPPLLRGEIKAGRMETGRDRAGECQPRG